MEEQNINGLNVQGSIIKKGRIINRGLFYFITIILDILVFRVALSVFLTGGPGWNDLDKIYYTVAIEFILTVLFVISYEIYRYKKDEKASFKPLIIIVLLIVAIIIYFIKLTGIFSNNFNVVGY